MDQSQHQPQSLPRAPVSVVIPCYRCAETIERAVASVLAQTQGVAELILVDDASGDGTWSTLERLQARLGATFVQLAAMPVNKGAGEARNLGWERASQPWIAFLDADDAWHPRKIELQYRRILQHPQTMLSCHATLISERPDWELDHALLQTAAYRPVRAALLPYLNVIPARSVMLRRDIPWRFYAGKRYSEDFALWMKIVCSGAPAYKLELPLACSFRPEFSGNGASAKLWRQEKGELDALRTIRDERLISRATWGAATLWSGVKFARRVALRRSW